MSILKHLESLICHPESRYPHAFGIGERTFVTDSVICIELFGEFSTENRYQPPKADKLIDAIDFSIAVHQLPVVAGPPEGANPFWEVGPTESTCGECYGLGEVTCEYGHEHDCPECGGIGKVDSVSLCDEATEPIGVLGAPFARRYLWILSQVCGTTIGLIPGDPNRLVFKFDGGRGVLCGMSVEATP